MTKQTTQEPERELEAAILMVKDLQKLWNSYAKKALLAKQERELRQVKKGFLDYENEEELADGYGWNDIDEDSYKRGLEYFENLKKPPVLSVIEQHRKNILELLNLWKGTVSELNEELHPTEDVPVENSFDKLARLEREERSRQMRASDTLQSLRRHEK